MTVAPDSIKFYYWDGSEWVDITGYVRSGPGVGGFWAMKTNKHDDRLAQAGEMRMTLDNRAGKFDPDGASVLTGFAKNTKVKMVITYDATPWCRFYGTVGSITFSDPNVSEHTANVTVVDFMGYFYRKTLSNQSIETYKRGGYIAAAIVDAVGQTPLATSYDTGDYEFPAAFDSMTQKTSAAAELNKLVLSENGYFYCKHDRVNGETLVFEAESTRNALRTVAQIPLLVADCGDLLMANSATDHILMAGSATDKIILNEAQDADFDGLAKSYQRSHGDNILNKISVTAYPKRIDTSQQTLYSLGTPMRLDAGETKTITVRYQNASTKESCNAITSLMSQPVVTTDYLMNSKNDGTGTNLTTSLTVTVVYYTSEAQVTLTNSSENKGFVTRLYLKGYGIYQDSSTKATAEDAASQEDYGIAELNIEQQYRRNTADSESMIYRMLYSEKDPHTRLESVTFIANKSEKAMLAFLALDIGDMVHLTQSTLGVDDDYYIQGIEFNISEGDLIMFKWILVLAVALGVALSPVSIEFDNTAGQNVLFNNQIDALEQKTIMLTFDMDSFGDTAKSQYLVSKAPAWWVFIGTSSEKIYFYNGFSSAIGTWATDNSSFSAGLHDIAITYDASSSANAPIIYLDGSSINVNTITPPAGDYERDNGIPVVIGSHGSSTKSPDGNVYNVRIYNRVLSAGDIATETATPGTITDGLVFSGVHVPSFMETYYDGRVLAAGDKIFEQISLFVGTPNGSPIANLLP